MIEKYDFIVVGAGLFGAVFAHAAKRYGKKALIIEQSDKVGGACYTERRCGTMVHKFGAHIFHTSDEEVWNFITSFGEFKPYTHQVMAQSDGKLYNLPFNMNTFYQLFGAKTVGEAKEAIVHDSKVNAAKNLKSFCERNFGTTIYETLVRNYTQKQWGLDCSILPQSLIERLPMRFEFNNNYFNDRFQGIPVDGYTVLIERMIEGIERMLNIDYKSFRVVFPEIAAKKVIYCGAIDEFYDYCFGALGYRTLDWDEEVRQNGQSQGCAVVNFTDSSTPYTRAIEHKWFLGENPDVTLVSYEKASNWRKGKVRYYPIPTKDNLTLYQQYKAFATTYNPEIVFCGRIGSYQYNNMDKTIMLARQLANELCEDK